MPRPTENAACAPGDDWAGKPWGRRADEPLSAYQAFLAYLRLGPGRTYNAAQKAIRKASGAKNSDSDRLSGPFGARAKRFDWKERAEAYDVAAMQREQLVRQDYAERSLEEWARGIEEVRSRLFDAVGKLINRAEEFLSIPANRTSVAARDIPNYYKAALEILNATESAVRPRIDAAQGQRPSVEAAQDGAAQRLEQWRAARRAELLSFPQQAPAIVQDPITTDASEKAASVASERSPAPEGRIIPPGAAEAS